MRDGSVFRWPSDLWRGAWEIKYGDRPDAVREAVEAVDQHWTQRTVMTKLGPMSWEETRSTLASRDGDFWPGEYEDQAHLAHDVL